VPWSLCLDEECGRNIASSHSLADFIKLKYLVKKIIVV